MSIPTIDRIEYPVSSIGSENSPQGVIVKGTLWTLQTSFGRFILKEFNGYYTVIKSLIAKRYLLTKAIKNNLTFDTDRFWVWIINYNNELSLYELEPYFDAPPVITYTKMGIATGVANVSSYLKENDSLRLIVLYNTKELKSLSYANIRLPDDPIVTDLDWGTYRLTDISNFVNDSNSQLDIVYLDVASPPNVYADSYIVGVPGNFDAVQIGNTRQIDLSWDMASMADEYQIDRDISASFTSPTSIYTMNLIYPDLVPTAGTFYYRIRGLNNSLLLQSTWSSTISVTLALNAEFTSDTQTAFVGDDIQFSDQSTPLGAVSTWLWDFGDGNTSALQNPIHSYSLSGIYDVTLTVYSGTLLASITKPNYITISPTLIADFLADPSSGDANLIVNFTDQSLGYPISWEWDFGDGSPHSFVRNPVHVYFIAGVHSVTLTVSDGAYTAVTSKDVTVNMVADFVTDVVSGYADLTVNFTDTSWGTPTSWYWDFGDGSYSTEQNPAHTYTTSGHFTVSLSVSRDPGTGAYTDTIVQTDLLSVYTKAEFSGSPRIGYQNLLVQFVDESKGGPTSWYWDFGDENFSDEQNPSHEYKSPGEYTVVLTAASFFNSDIETKKKYIIVEGTATPDIAPEPDILLYTDGQVKVNKEKKGIRVVYLKNSSSY